MLILKVNAFTIAIIKDISEEFYWKSVENYSKESA